MGIQIDLNPTLTTNFPHQLRIARKLMEYAERVASTAKPEDDISTLDFQRKSSGKIYWYGAGTEVLDESDSSGNITDEYVYFGGKRVSHRVVSTNALYFYGEDMLGSSRTVFTSAGVLCYDADFSPWGTERAYTSTCSSNYKFERKERDTETGNDDFGARYYSSSFGRWTSPDWSAIPEPVPYANLTNPQTLNLYAMVSDNPETFGDLNGHKWLQDFLKGLSNATWRPLVTMVEHPILTGNSIANSVAHPIATYHALKNSTVTTTQQVMAGNGTAIGTVVGTVGMLLLPGAGEAADGVEAIDTVAEAGEVAEDAAAAAAEKTYEDGLAAAQEAYPNKAGNIENHHIDPKYLGGAADGATSPIDAAYHRQITNAFRQQAKYGSGPVSAEQLQQIKDAVYSQYPLPK